jgi:hypothetical protein
MDDLLSTGIGNCHIGSISFSAVFRQPPAIDVDECFDIKILATDRRIHWFSLNAIWLIVGLLGPKLKNLKKFSVITNLKVTCYPLGLVMCIIEFHRVLNPPSEASRTTFLK